MPTPRFFNQIAITPVVPQIAPQAADSSTWVSGSIQTSTGPINAVFTVGLDDGRTVSCTSAIDSTLDVGSLVWVVVTGTQGLIVATR